MASWRDPSPEEQPSILIKFFKFPNFLNKTVVVFFFNLTSLLLLTAGDIQTNHLTFTFIYKKLLELRSQLPKNTKGFWFWMELGVAVYE